MADITEWLLSSEPYIEYNTRINLMGQKATLPEVISAKEKMIDDPKIRLLLDELKNWPGQILNSHKSAGHPLHKLSFIADIGLTKEYPSVTIIAEKILSHQSNEGPFQVLTNVPKHFGGSGEDTWAWSLCDAPVILYSLAKIGYDADPRVQQAVAYLAELVSQNGWHCIVSKELGNFRGPGRKDDSCPYATLVMLKMLAQFPEFVDSKATRNGTECLLNLWENSLKLHPYIFYMGNDFRKLKAPFVWYDLLHVFDVLTNFSWLKKDSRLAEMAALIRSKKDEDGLYTVESQWQQWKGWDFGQKKQPSRWLTYLALRSLKKFQSG